MATVQHVPAERRRDHSGSAVERVWAALAEAGCQPRGPHLAFRAKCPAHQSHGPTLAIRQGESGAIVKCHAQCETTDVLTAIGLSFGDLFDKPRERERQRRERPKDTRSERLGAVIWRIAHLQMIHTAMRLALRQLPVLPPGVRVARAETLGAADTGTHYWQVLARWAALACDRGYVRQASADVAAWLAGTGPKPAHEQFMVLATRAEDRARMRGAA